MIFNKRIKSESILRKRIRKFKGLKRGYYSFIILITLYIISFLNPLLINNKALVVKYNGEYFFPVTNYYPSNTFSQKGYGEAQYRKLDKHFKDYLEYKDLELIYNFSFYIYINNKKADSSLLA